MKINYIIDIKELAKGMITEHWINITITARIKDNRLQLSNGETITSFDLNTGEEILESKPSISDCGG